MPTKNIICIDDQREVLTAVRKDLEQVAGDYEILDCESAKEAEEVLEDLYREGEEICLIICDHIMPGENGIDFLTRLNDEAKYQKTKKMILTGLATQQDTIKAINEAKIDCFIEKPWDQTQFTGALKEMLGIPK
jgi:two-component system chemotaxis response regulator CheY